MITKINESKTLIKYIPCDCRNVIRVKSGMKNCADVSVRIQ